MNHPVPDGIRQSITVGPIGCMFTNRNTDMGLRAHSHLAEVFVTWTHHELGFPVFESTVREVGDAVRAVVEHPITGTNEQVARLIFQALDGWKVTHPEWVGVGDYQLDEVVLAVRGIPDSIGHSDGFGRYSVRRAS